MQCMECHALLSCHNCMVAKEKKLTVLNRALKRNELKATVGKLPKRITDLQIYKGNIYVADESYNWIDVTD